MSADKSPSTIVYEFAKAAVDAALADTILKDADVLDSANQEISADKGIVVSNSEFDLAPKQQNEIGIYDGLVIIGFYYRIPGADVSERKEARDKCFQMAVSLSEKIYADMSLGNRVCDCLLLSATDGGKSVSSDSYAIINLPIILNPTGDRRDYRLGEAK